MLPMEKHVCFFFLWALFSQGYNKNYNFSARILLVIVSSKYSLLFAIDQKGHGIPESLIKEVKKISHQFFDRPYEEKLKIKLTPQAGYRFA